MEKVITSEKIDQHRRRLFGAAAMTVAAAQFGMIGLADAKSSKKKLAELPTVKPGTHTSFASLKQIDAGLLNVGYAEAGPSDGPVVILLHGWPYDIHSFVDVAPLLASAGCRVIVPFVRGCGTTRFLSETTFRNGQPSVVAVDTIALMDALKIDKAILAGFDWGARTANIIAVLWPERCKAMVSVSGYLIGARKPTRCRCRQRPSRNGGTNIYFATERGRAGYDKYRHDFAKLIWQIASPKWHFNDATFDRTAAAFDNPDHVGIVIHNYRWRLGLAEGDPKYDDLEKRLAEVQSSPCRRSLWKAMLMALRMILTSADLLKVRGREGKVALRRAFADLLPAEATTRGKTGFGVPLGRWFRSDLRELAYDLLPGRSWLVT